MACRVGMSTNPDERIAYWKKEEGHKSSKILAKRLTYKAAQRREKQEATKKDCHYKPGGQYKSGNNWSVYRVWGGKISKKPIKA